MCIWLRIYTIRFIFPVDFEGNRFHYWILFFQGTKTQMEENPFKGIKQMAEIAGHQGPVLWMVAKFS